MFDLPWHVYLLQLVAGLFLANGVPHFVQGISGHWFQTPFASPPGVGTSGSNPPGLVAVLIVGLPHRAAVGRLGRSRRSR